LRPGLTLAYGTTLKSLIAPVAELTDDFPLFFRMGNLFVFLERGGRDAVPEITPESK